MLSLALLAGVTVQLALPQGAAVPPAFGVTRAPDRRLPAIGEVGAPDLAGRPSFFSPLRVVGDKLAAQEAALGGDAAAPKPVGPLDGTFVLGSMKYRRASAVLLREAGGRVLRLPPGGSYKGWQVLRIEADAALFRKNGKTTRIAYGTTAPAGDSATETSESDSE
jgi:hypothetical protein